ncbi:MAG TPA: 5-oxoprolinase/urea amidolyase family protein [Burkholderiaceae bacterium]|nr:5-oxoprolinase/urea amidolyase family protein [Burkholderiaceae bacterium]
MRFMPASDSALLVELDNLGQAMALYRQLRQHPIHGVSELVPAARTVLVQYRPSAITPTELLTALRERGAAAEERQNDLTEPGRLVEIPVHYNGEDLPEVAELLGITVSEVIARHTERPYLAAFAGFAPGFVYLAGGHPSFQLPRRTSPRTKVPAGSVAVAGDFSAVYPSDSPGGWQLLGVTDIPMWDLSRPEPAYIQPGFRVQFRNADTVSVPVSMPAALAGGTETQLVNADSLAGGTDPQSVKAGSLAAEVRADADEPSAPIQSGAQLEILQSGIQTLFQDTGRVGMAGLGVSPSGALDLPSMRQANRLVGNPSDTPVLENVLGGLQLRSFGRTVIAVTGADVPLTLRDAEGRALPQASHQAIALDDGDVLILGNPARGVRTYIAVRGGWQVEPVLGSCATDTLARIGPPALQAGMRFEVGTAVPRESLRAVELAEPDIKLPLPAAGELVTLDVIMGPRDDWFTEDALQRFAQQEWVVTPQSNRIGMRLESDVPLTRIRNDELPSEGTVSGAIQVPISGQPVLFLADHPLTGGYPVIAGVAGHHLALAAQIPIGCRIRFNVIAPPISAQA